MKNEIKAQQKSEFFEGFRLLAKKHGMSPSELASMAANNIAAKVKADYPDCGNISVKIDAEENKEKVDIRIIKTIVANGSVKDSGNEISLDDAKELSRSADINKKVRIKAPAARYLEELAEYCARARREAEFFISMKLLAEKNQISIDDLADNIGQNILKAAKKYYSENSDIRVEIDTQKETFDVKLVKKIVEGEPEDTAAEISLEEAKELDENAEVGGEYVILLDTTTFNRVTTSSAKQSIKQDIRMFERERLLSQFDSKREECVAAVVTKVEPATLNAIVTIDGSEAYLRRNEQIPGETLKAGDSIQVYVETISDSEKRPAIKISRTKREMVRKLFEREVPEIYDGIVEIKSVAREAGSRTKLAVFSKDKNVDAVGSCIGPKHTRISAVIKELKGEKIDVIPYSEDDAEFIANALSPAQVLRVDILDEDIKSCRVVVPNNQLSLAIGNKGLNAKLAHHLTGYKIDIVPETPVED